MLKYTLLLVCVLGTALAQEGFKCPHDFGYYPHQRSCDKYWKCEGGQADLKTCGNGLAFETNDAKFLTENCDYLHNVDCGDRNQLEPPISTANCPRLYGIFPDEEKCDVFWSCWGGESNRYSCSPGLAYDRDARVCMWSDQVPECREEEGAGGFKCPTENEGAVGSFSRHAHPEDCRKYFICLSKTPREYGCPIGTVFKIGADDFSGTCTDPEDVPGCEDYYGDLDLKSLKKSELLLGLEGDSGPKSKPTYTRRNKDKYIKPIVPPKADPTAAPAPRPTSPNRQFNSPPARPSRPQPQTQQQQQQPQQQTPSRPSQQQAVQSRPSQQQAVQSRPSPSLFKPSTPSRLQTTTQAPTTAKLNEEEYYYEDYPQ